MIPTSDEVDKFGEVMDQMASMSKQEIDMKLYDLEQMCVCSTCPSYNFCAKQKGEVLFCAKGRSACIGIPKGCDCDGCQVKEDLDLRHKSFCMRGPEKEQRK